MRRTRWTHLLACAVCVGVVTWVAQDLVLQRHGWVPSLTAWGAVVALVVAALVLAAGVGVRRLRERRETWMTPTGAAVTAAAAQASSLVGSAMTGAYGAEIVVAVRALRRAQAPAMADLALMALVCLLAAVVWIGVGLLVESWCAIGEDGDDDPHAGGADEGEAHAGAAARSQHLSHHPPQGR